MIRRIIHIDEEKCDGCGLCAKACHEGAIDIIGGKAKLVREHFCDGLGDCLPNCPMGAITFEEREAPAYDEAAVLAAKKVSSSGGCPGSQMMQMQQKSNQGQGTQRQADKAGEGEAVSRLLQWPCQIKLIPAQAPIFHEADLLIAADCTAYAYANMHEKFMKGKVTLIGCPKLDNIDYTDKLSEILANNEIKSVTLVRMEVPCCGGLQRAVANAMECSGKKLPCQVVIIARNGSIMNEGFI